MPYFESDGLKLAYRIEGDGSPILLVHGFASTHRVNWVQTSWSRTLIEAGFRVIMADGRGHGASDKPHASSAYTLDAMAEDIVALLDHLGEPGVDLMGYSMGAMVSLVAAANHPERFDRVIAAGVGERLLDKSKSSRDVVEALLTDDPSAIRNPAARLFRTFAEQNDQDRRALAACFAAVRRDFPVEALARIANPVLIVAGEADEAAGAPEPLAARIRDARAHVVPKRDHMKTVGDRDYKEAVLKFLAE